MITINTVLPVYDRLIKQCYERSKCVGGDQDMIVPVITSRHRFPSMQWNVEADDPGELTSIELIDQYGNSTNIINYFNRTDKFLYLWFNGGGGLNYDTFTPNTPPAPASMAAAKTTAAGVDWAGCTIALGASVTQYTYNYTYQRVRVDVTLTLNSGTAPKMELRDAATCLVTYSNTVTLVNGRNIFFLTPTGNTGAALYLVVFNGDTETTNFTLAHTNLYGIYASHPMLFTNTDGDEYFMYNELSSTVDPYLKYALDPGIYYLKFTSLAGYIYYSDYFKVDCVYTNLLAGLVNFNYDTFTTSGTAILSAINAAGNATAYSSNAFSVIIDKSYTLIFNVTATTGQLPSFSLVAGATISNTVTAVSGLNSITLTATASSDVAYLVIANTGAATFTTTEMILFEGFSSKYLKFVFSHSCNLGELIYEDDFEQVLYLESETMEPVFPYTEKGQENGYGQFIPTWQRQEKNYVIKTLLIPQFLVDVLHRLKLHDSIVLTDLVGDTRTVRDIEVEHEWQFDDKYYALATITVGLGEEIVVTGCCTVINDCV